MTQLIPNFKRVFVSTIIVLSIFVVSCKKGDIGPTGPPGATGATGANGLNGAAGTNGTNGSSNVQSYSFTVNPNDWSWYANNSGSQWQFTKTINTGKANSAIMVYQDGIAMPFYDAIFQSYYGFYTDNMTTVMLQYYNGTTTISRPAIPHNYLIVAIPPAMIKPNINHSNLIEIKAAYNL